jgi:hypothetical protein
MVDRIPLMWAEKEFIIPYSNNVRKRHYHKTTRGKVVKFVVQLEIKYKTKWREVVRYDCAHGYAHRDSYNLLGRHTKEELYLRFEDALILADDDIDENWKNYKRKFLEGDIP